ncbi:MAG: response regulator [Lachnospiraceae bacterium]|nr:response regulator [Lachnospiraceae bacterium]
MAKHKMKKRPSKIANFIGFLRNEDVSIDAKGLYLVIVYSMIINLGYAVVFFMTPVTSACLYVSAAILVLFGMLVYLLNRYDETDIFKYVVVITLNFLIFPMLFYMTGNLINGALLFFVLGIVFTFFLIREKSAYFIFLFEIIWYCIILVLPMLDYEKFAPYSDSIPNNIGIPASFLAAAIAPVFIFVYQTVNYERTKKQLNESRMIIESARYNKSRFLANVTHEIRTPMNAIIGMNELILREDLDPESRELAENIKQSSTQLLKIINNILEFSKLDSDKMELFAAKYDFKALMTEIIDAVSNEYAAENIEFTAKIDPEIPKTLFGDSLRIKQVFMYLLFSSVHMLPHSRMSMEVEGVTDIGTNTVLLSCTISESGFGLSESEIEAMLSAYTKYDSRQKSDYKGMGLELSICKEILELMGGSLSIKSVEGVGMSVHFEFINYIIEDAPIVRVSSLGDYNILVYTKNPNDRDLWVEILSHFQLYPNFVNGPNAFRQAIENRRYTHIFIDDMFYPMLKDTIRSAQISDDIYVLTEAGSIYSDFDKCKIIRRPVTSINVANALNNAWDEARYKVAQRREAVTYPEGKIMIVDDSIVNLKVLEGMLLTFNLNITQCKSGAEALRVLENDEFDLIILDQRMPEMDGIELLHLIRKLDNANSMVPILCATADFGPDVSRMLLNEGFQDYLAKPVRRFYLERMLRKYMPSELAVNIVVEGPALNEDTQKDETKTQNSDTKADPKEIEFNIGLANVGGQMEAFSSVLNAYYREGLLKCDSILQTLAGKDYANYIIEVHALKSSSLAIGAAGMSVLFRELEFAGKANNIEFIESHNRGVFETFKEVLDVVKGYLMDNGIFESADNIQMPGGDIEPFDVAVIEEILNNLTNFNIKAVEEKMNELCGINYGTQLNRELYTIKSQIDMFDYHKAKEMLVDLKRRQDEYGI